MMQQLHSVRIRIRCRLGIERMYYSAMTGLARSPVGFVDTHYARFVNRMQRGQFILKLGLAWDVAQTEPLLFKPLMVEAREPGAGEIGEMFRGQRSGKQ